VLIRKFKSVKVWFLGIFEAVNMITILPDIGEEWWLVGWFLFGEFNYCHDGSPLKQTRYQR